MAKKKNKSINDIFSNLQSINPLSTLDMANSEIGKISGYIDSGNWALNAALSGSIKKGLAANKIAQFAGESGAGKTFLTLNLVKNAQKDGYSIMYIDTESISRFSLIW